MGKVSLWTSICGIFAPVLLALAAQVVVGGKEDVVRLLCMLLFGGAELVALVTGAMSRKTTFGKAGLVISGIVLLLTAIVVLVDVAPAS